MQKYSMTACDRCCAMSVKELENKVKEGIGRNF